MSDYKELVRRLEEKYILGTPGHRAAQVIENLSAQLETEEATNDRLRDEIAEAVGARERMAAEVERLKRELAEARENAKVLDELEAWLHENRGVAAVMHGHVASDTFSCRMVFEPACTGPDLLTAVEAALAKAKETT